MSHWGLRNLNSKLLLGFIVAFLSYSGAAEAVTEATITTAPISTSTQAKTTSAELNLKQTGKISELSFSGLNLQKLTSENYSIDPSKKGLVVLFMSSTCPCSASHQEEIKKLSEEYKDFAFVGIHSNFAEKTLDASTYFKTADFKFPVFEDHEQIWANELKAVKTPHAFVILKNKTLAFKGGVSDSHIFAKSEKHFLRAALADLTSGKMVQTPVARALGCYIERKSTTN